MSHATYSPRSPGQSRRHSGVSITRSASTTAAKSAEAMRMAAASSPMIPKSGTGASARKTEASDRFTMRRNRHRSVTVQGWLGWRNEASRPAKPARLSEMPAIVRKNGWPVTPSRRRPGR